MYVRIFLSIIIHSNNILYLYFQYLLFTFSGYILLQKLPKQHEIMGNKNIFAILFFHNNIPGIFPLGTHISLNRDRFHKPLSAIQKSKQL